MLPRRSLRKLIGLIRLPPFRHSKKVRNYLFAALIIILCACTFISYQLSNHLHAAYLLEESTTVIDRNGRILLLRPNEKGEFMTRGATSTRVRELVVKSEDKYFYYHLGVNPISTLRSISGYLFHTGRGGGSTITQQLAKNLLHHENDRTIANKLSEIVYAVALELHTSKEDILSMYLDTAYFGERMEGIEQASLHYYGKSPAQLEDGEIVRLLALLSAPSVTLDTAANTLRAKRLANRIGVAEPSPYQPIPRRVEEVKKTPTMFELGSLASCTASCALTVDGALSEKIRDIVQQNLSSPIFASVGSAAVAVIKLGKGEAPNQLLALVGTPNPYGGEDGNQINMALEARPIGSTWKPFIYGEAIENGVRPYTLIDDSEYRYEIGTGFAFYPKNYDGIYRGPVTVNYALSNSLNVPAVRALGFVGVDDFGEFMQRELGLIPRQSFDTYQLSIALGGLEMNPLLLAEYFTVFPRNGTLAPLTLFQSGIPANIPMQRPVQGITKIFAPTTTALMSRMLSDRLMGVEQFGLESNLNLPFEHYAVKTGTTYDYHDSWTVGYTSDIVVSVWIGNTDNKAMDQLSGARGAGKIWHDVMALLYADGETHPEAFSSEEIVSVYTEEGESFALEGDDVARTRLMLSRKDMVLEPHDGDVLLYQKGMSVPLRSVVPVSWSVGDVSLGKGDNLFWNPTHAGDYLLTAKPVSGKAAILRIHIVLPN